MSFCFKVIQNGFLQTVGVPIHAHAATRTMAPDWVELAQVFSLTSLLVGI
jgi:hypothetical protein